LLPFVAGFTWGLLRGLTSARMRWFMLAGGFAAGALLTKYFALVLIAAIGVDACALADGNHVVICGSLTFAIDPERSTRQNVQAQARTRASRPHAPSGGQFWIWSRQ
jgi:hypothetical protein